MCVCVCAFAWVVLFVCVCVCIVPRVDWVDMSAGMHAFFQTHKCSDVCKALGLKEGMLPQGRRTSKRPT